jgi:hypothetical protein
MFREIRETLTVSLYYNLCHSITDVTYMTLGASNLPLELVA